MASWPRADQRLANSSRCVVKERNRNSVTAKSNAVMRIRVRKVRASRRISFRFVVDSFSSVSKVIGVECISRSVDTSSLLSLMPIGRLRQVFSRAEVSAAARIHVGQVRLSSDWL